MGLQPPDAMLRHRLEPLALFCLLACSDDPTAEDGGSRFAGVWEFDLTVTGSLCPGDDPQRDCFRIFQDGDELLIVDPSHGNLTGFADGRLATLTRDNDLGSVLLTLEIHSSGDRLQGTALEFDAVRDCTTELSLDGSRRGSPCS